MAEKGSVSNTYFKQFVIDLEAKSGVSTPLKMILVTSYYFDFRQNDKIFTRLG